MRKRIKQTLVFVMLFALLLSATAFASSEEPAAEAGELVSYEG